MAIKKMAVTLYEDELTRLRGIIDEEDEDEALAFIRDVLEVKVKENELPHCVPFFDAGYNPGQSDHYA